MSLQTRTLLMVTCLLITAVLAMAATLTWSARGSLLEQKAFDGVLIADLLARSAQFADEAATGAEHAIGEQMVVEATMAAHLVAAAEASGAGPEEINARLRDIADRTALNEMWITDDKGYAYLGTHPEVKFRFNPDPRVQPQAHRFWGLLTGERFAVVQETRKREIDNQVFKYAGVAGVDRPRIVQVGYRADFIERLREEVGLTRLTKDLVATGKVLAVRVVDPGLVTLVYSAIPGQDVRPEVSDTDTAYLKRAVSEKRTLSYFDGSVLKVTAPVTGAGDRMLGAALVQLATPHMAAAIQRGWRVAALVAAIVLAGSVLASVVAVRQVTRPVRRLTAAARTIEAGAAFDPQSIRDVAERNDEVGKLARVFRRMAREVYAREQSLKQQVQELRIEIDEAKKEREVAEITETEYFQQLRQRAKQLRNRSEQPKTEVADGRPSTLASESAEESGLTGGGA